MNSEQIYSHEIARRSVARAALHLGIETMSEEALDVLADVLLNYLERIGAALSKLVESSGRTSAHSNIFDAMEAIEITTSPVVHQLLYYPTENDDDATAAANDPVLTPTTIWQELASFSFGPNWNNPAKANSNGAGGKGLPSESTITSGWVAPYLDEVLHFPTASDSCANPLPHQIIDSTKATTHIKTTKVTANTGKNHDNQVDEWGGMGHDESTLAPPPHKKAKHTHHHHHHIPSFFPPLPDASSQSSRHRSIVETQDVIPQELDNPTAVRSSLVDLKITPGRAKTSNTTTPHTIVPLARASVHRVSKILEGSMDQMN